MSTAPQILRRPSGRLVTASADDAAPTRTPRGVVRSLQVPGRIVHLGGDRRPDGNAALVSSAAVLAGTRVKRSTKAMQPNADRNRAWQEEAWYYWESTGALRYATRYEAAAMSRARLVGKRAASEAGAEPATLPREHPVSQMVEAMLGGPSGQARALETISTHLYVVGLSYLVGYVDEDGDEVWQAVTPDELTIGETRVTLKMSDTGDSIELPRSSVVVIRMWNPHPRRWWEPDSTVRGAFTELRELEGLAKHVSATIDSRLAGAGLLLVPQEMTFVSNRDDLADGQDPFIVEFIETAMRAMEDRDSAAALVPIVLKVPGAFIDKVSHVTFSTDFDERVPMLREGALGRLAIALDLPKEVLLGMGEASYRTSWGIEESAIKMHFEPKLDRIASGLTQGLLIPGLEAALDDGSLTLDDLGISDRRELRDFCVGYDTTALKLRPSRVEDAESLHEDLLITDETRRRVAGFSEEDAPEIGSQEWLVMILRNAITDQPQFADVILPVLGQVLDNQLLMDIQPITGRDGRRDEGTNNAPDDEPQPASPIEGEDQPSGD